MKENAGIFYHYIFTGTICYLLSVKITHFYSFEAPTAGVGNSLSLAGHIGKKIIYGGQYKYHMDLIELTLRENGLLAFQFRKRSILRGIFNLLST